MKYYQSLNLEDLPGEIWEDVLGFKGYYKISNYGRLKSLDIYVKRGKTGVELKKGRIKKLYKNSCGYLCSNLYKDTVMSTVRIHRLVAIAFVSNILNEYTVNHKDGNKLNNFDTNLEWASLKANIKHGFDTGLYDSIKRPVIMMDFNGNELKEFKSIKEANLETKIPNPNICKCCKGVRPTAGGYTWKYKNTTVRNP